MSTHNQGGNKARYRCVTESSTTIAQEGPVLSKPKEIKLQITNKEKRLIRKQQSTNVLHLQEYKPLKSQIVCLGSAKDSNANNEQPFKKKHRYLRYDAYKQANSKQMSRSLSKSKTASTESLRIHKMRSINVDKEKGKKDNSNHLKRMSQIKHQFLKLTDTINKINQEEMSSTKRAYNKLVQRNRQISIKIISNSVRALLQKQIKLPWNLMLNYQAELH